MIDSTNPHLIKDHDGIHLITDLLVANHDNEPPTLFFPKMMKRGRLHKIQASKLVERANLLLVRCLARCKVRLSMSMVGCLYRETGIYPPLASEIR